MNDEEGEIELLSDWNFIVTNGGNTIYDLTAGIRYRYETNEELKPAVYVLRVGSPPDALFTYYPLYQGDEAVEFWQKLKDRVELNFPLDGLPEE